MRALLPVLCTCLVTACAFSSRQRAEGPCRVAVRNDTEYVLDIRYTVLSRLGDRDGRLDDLSPRRTREIHAECGDQVAIEAQASADGAAYLRHATAVAAAPDPAWIILD